MTDIVCKSVIQFTYSHFLVHRYRGICCALTAIGMQVKPAMATKASLIILLIIEMFYVISLFLCCKGMRKEQEFMLSLRYL